MFQVMFPIRENGNETKDANKHLTVQDFNIWSVFVG